MNLSRRDEKKHANSPDWGDETPKAIEMKCGLHHDLRIVINCAKSDLI
jgi:hypothetical protein